ncbi:hypothetical protein M407DRAFT_22765 [Tulasnella calospora MUT 4182]|uniref:Uncharacterized protein n=1 Tax=Tulasnella calospora MUT 4182 TaxID=1051891 RepID=A0A0C3M2Q5_9AGAM|nr:hypothetical protein M407DRAFT_22765 [Tulasnella calospora MUT 4182]
MAPITIQEFPTEILMQVLTLALPEDPWEWRMELVQQLALALAWPCFVYAGIVADC